MRTAVPAGIVGRIGMGEFRAEFQVVDGLAESGVWAARMPIDSARKLYAGLRLSVIDRSNDTFLHIEQEDADAFRTVLTDIERATPSSQAVILISCSNDAYPVVRSYCESLSWTVFRPSFKP
jgi:hypothetical protein